jgi:UPF0755 protein
MSEKVTAVLLVAIICFLVSIHTRFFSSSDKMLINMRRGDSALVVAIRLRENKLICSKKLFLYLIKFTKAQNKFKSGVYSFSEKDGMFKILRNLKSGSKNFLRFTVPEGSNIKQTAKIISRTLNIDKKNLLKLQ